MPRLSVTAARAAGYAWASLPGSVYMHYAGFVRPSGSTAALGLLFVPLWNLCCSVRSALFWPSRSSEPLPREVAMPPDRLFERTGVGV